RGLGEVGAADVVVAVCGGGSAAEVVAWVLGLVQGWVGEERWAGSRLVVVTRAVDAVWGLVRSAQAEFPGRFVLVEADGPEGVVAAVSSGEPQVAVRG
ncbi:SpnB-like Rossmann fold domain-containing protein, partial [Streptomyces rubellomurinus]|uniref:SpnB-like Rossmann fold domain-containing protein n=1 Tax=Streptomyces rubellomurinus (strain ATCC 31215) TaxID=359131 RepID=UPI0005F25A0C